MVLTPRARGLVLFGGQLCSITSTGCILAWVWTGDVRWGYALAVAAAAGLTMLWAGRVA